MAKLEEIMNDTPDINYDPEIAMSERFTQAQKAVDWGSNPYFSLSEADKASNDPINEMYTMQDLVNVSSVAPDAGDVAWNSFRKMVVDLNSLGDKAQLVLGNQLAGLSGNTIGTQMRDNGAKYLMKTMEDSRFIDSNFRDPDEWTARWLGGGLSMVESATIGMLTGPVGLAAYIGTTSLADGALNDMVKYQEEHGTLEGYETDPVNLAIDDLNALWQVYSELAWGAPGKLARGKLFKPGRTLSSVGREFLENQLQETSQGVATDLAEVLKGNQNASILLDNAWGHIKDGFVAGILGGTIAGVDYKFNKNRALNNLDMINRKLHPEMTDAEIRKESEIVFEKTEQKAADTFIPELVARQEASNDQGATRDNVRQKVEMMYRDNEDMSEKEKATAIEATTTTELENMLYDSIEKKIPLTANPLLQGEVNELGWFRDGIPENRRSEINALNDEIRELKQQKVEATEQKDYNKLDEIETKIEEFRKNLPMKLRDLVIADREEIKNMLDEQRKAVQESQDKKQLFQKVKQMARSAAEKQDKTEAKLAEQIATGAEKAKAKREKAETALQTKEAKIRSLQEQRQIASAIKNVKLKAQQNKIAEPSVQTHYEEESGYNTLKEAGLTDEEIQKMSYRDMMDRLEQIKKAKENASEPEIMLQDEVFKIADENARLDDIYPAYDGETIEVDGKERTVYNSNGDRIAKSKEALTNFWRWFGDSKVVDEQGRPLVVYHGTEAEFDTFDKNITPKRNNLLGQGFYFTNQQDKAKWFGKNIMPVYLKIENPETNAKIFPDTEKLKQSGKDGIIKDQTDILESEPITYVAFEPNQIKSVDNRGTYSADTGNIYYQSEESEASRLEMQRKFANNYFDGFITDIEQDGLANFVKEDGVYKQKNKSYPPIEINSAKGQYASYDPVRDVISLSVPGLKNMSENQVVDYIKNHREEIHNSLQHEYKHFYDIAKGASVSAFKQRLMNILPWMYYNNKLEADAFTQEFLSQLAAKFNSLSPFEKEKLLSVGRDTYVRETYNEILRKSLAPKAWNKENTDIFKKRLGEQFDMFKENPNRTMYQNKPSDEKGGGKQFRGAYIPEYRFITMTENMDASTLAHELAHDWGQEYFRWARSGKASDSFMKSWGAVERAIGITDKDTYFTYDASEKFARAYEGWLMERQDWAKILHINNDEEKKAVEDAMEDYRQELVDIYDSLTNPYFTMAWGKTGELKPELKEWFERSTKFDSLDEQVRRGEITAEQASEEKLKDMLETATNNSVENMSEEDKKAVRTIENLEKLEQQTKEIAKQFETEGGNRNAIQARLNQIALAKDIAANSAVLKYDTHRDMLEVAKAADEFVKTRREDAIKIINGEMAEQDGLFSSDLYTALERVAKQTGDFYLIEELQHSKVATDLAKELGQRVAGFRNYTGNGEVDIVSALKKVDKIYEKAYNEFAKDEMSADLQAWAEDLQAVDSLADSKLDEFFKDMECQ